MVAEANLELGPLDIDMRLGKIEQHINGMKKVLDEDQYTIKRRVGLATIVTAVPTLLIIPKFPAKGRTWNITGIKLFGSDGHTVVAGGLADVYSGASEQPDFDGQILTAAAIPSISYFGRKINWCEEGEQIYCNIYGLTTPPQQVVFVAHVVEYPIDVIQAMSV